MQPDLRCYHHPEREATGQCDRCGDYLCGECIGEADGCVVCPGCLRDLTVPTLGGTGLAAGVLNAAVAVPLVATVVIGSIWALDILLSGLAWTLPAVMAAAVLALVRRRGEGPTAQYLRWSVVLASAAPLSVLVTVRCGMDWAVRTATGISPGAGGTAYFTWMGWPCVLLSVAAMVLCVKAVRKRVRPMWGALAVFLAPLSWTLMFVYYVGYELIHWLK